jgi:hypothetical protein
VSRHRPVRPAYPFDIAHPDVIPVGWSPMLLRTVIRGPHVGGGLEPHKARPGSPITARCDGVELRSPLRQVVDARVAQKDEPKLVGKLLSLVPSTRHAVQWTVVEHHLELPWPVSVPCHFDDVAVGSQAQPIPPRRAVSVVRHSA